MPRYNKKSLLPSSLVVTQSNQLVEARYNLPLAEQRLILTMISRIQPDDEDFKPYKISVSELAEFLGVDKGSVYRECKKTTESLLKRVLNIPEIDGVLQVGWVSSAKYIDGSGIVYLSFDPLLKPYLLQLKSNFTCCKLDMLLSFKSQYTMRIYTILKQYERLKVREIDLVNLRLILGVDENLHSEYRDFKRHVLLSSKNELFKKSDLYFEFDEIKHGRKVGAIRFHIFTKKITTLPTDSNVERIYPELSPPEVNISPTPLDQLLLLVPDHHRTKKTVMSSIESFEKKQGFDYVKRNILYCNTKAEKSYAGFLHSALKNDWGQDWELDQKTPVKKKVKPREVWEQLGYSSEQEYANDMFKKHMENLKK